MESLTDAKEELKRVDHLIYVSLKYTRTADIFINTISRMIDAYNHMFDALLKYNVEHKVIDEIPLAPIEKGNLLKELYKEDKITKNGLENAVEKGWITEEEKKKITEA